MVNANSHKHGMTTANVIRPKAKQWKRRNKQNARERAAARQGALQAALKQGN